MPSPMRSTDLGPFAADQGPVGTPTVAAAALAAGAAALALVRPLGDAVGSGDPVRWTTDAAVAAGVVGIAVAIVAAYLASARSERGAGLARVALAISAAAAVAAFVNGAVRDGSIQLGRFVERYFDGEVLRAIWGDLLHGAGNTVKAAAVAEVLAIGVGLVVATFELSPRRAIRLPAVVYVDVVRGLPLLVLTSLIFFGLTFIGLTLSPFAAIIASLTVNASAYVAEIFRAGIQAVARGQMDAARSLGMPYGTAMLHIVIPQAVRAVIPPLMSEFIALVKDTAIVYAIVGFTTRSADLYGVARTGAASTFSPTPYMAAAIGYLIITVPLTRLVGRLERRLRAGLA